MPNLGYSGPYDNTEWTGVNLYNQVGLAVTMPERGRITGITIHVAGYNTTCSTRTMLWDVNGTVLAQSGAFTLPSMPLADTSPTWVTGILGTPYDAAAAQTVYIGWWRDPQAQIQWRRNSGASGTYRLNTTTTGPTTLTAATTYPGKPGVYLTYSIGRQVKLWNGSAWIAKPVKINGSTVQIKLWDGSTWR